MHTPVTREDVINLIIWPGTVVWLTSVLTNTIQKLSKYNFERQYQMNSISSVTKEKNTLLMTQKDSPDKQDNY